MDADAKSNDAKLSLKYGETNFNEKNPKKLQHEKFYILLAFLLITIALLMAVRAYFYLIQNQVNELLPFHYTNNKLRSFILTNLL